MRFKSFMICLTVLLLALFLASCSGTAEEPTASIEPATLVITEPVPIPIDGSSLFAEAAVKAEALQAAVLTITSEKTTVIGSESYSESVKQVFSFSGLHSATLTGAMEETLTIGAQTVEISELYADGTGFFTVNGNCFSGQMTAEEYRSRYAPVILLDTDLYGSVLAESTDAGNVITFTQPSAMESWITPENAELLSASGTAKLSAKGDLIENTYDVTYSYGPAVIRETITVELDTDTTPVIELPEDREAYIPLDYPDAPRMLETATGYLLQAGAVTASINGTIVTEAGGVTRSQNVTINMFGNTTDEKMAEVETSVTLVDYSRNGETTAYHQIEHFQDGVYTFRAGDELPTENSAVTESIMRTYCQNSLIGTVPTPEFIENAVMTDLGSTILVEFTATEDLAQLMCASACLTLYNNENMLNNLATDYSTDLIEYYLAIDKFTGFPTASGIQFRGTHTIEGFPYVLSCQEDQAYCLSSLTAYEAITGSIPEDSQVYDDPTPLLYKVTGEDGQTLYLFGTIHMGDIRTSRLPQYVTDAFGKADALAVEFNTERFLEQSESDSALQASLAECYFYLDGTQLINHLPEDLAELAIRHLKASGNYNQNAYLLKPSFIETFIQNFYTQQGYHLTSENGMDSRLQKMANDAGKEILEVESGLSQARMLAGFPDALQQLLLQSAVEADPMEYIASVEQLYTLWCAGEESELRMAILDDNSMFTEEELELYEIYQKAMLTDRNAGMLKTAEGYLKSGKTVFYAVGLAHLLSPEDGLVDALRAAGYTVEKVSQ